MARKGRADDLAPRKEKGETNSDVEFWLTEIAASKKREKSFRTDGLRIREIYSGERKDSTPMNILFSNTETIAPATYSQVPSPVVRRRYKDDDPVGFAAAKAGERILSFLLDTNIEGYDTFNECLKAVNLDAWLPGRGVSSLKYDADIQELDDGTDETGKKKTLTVKKPYTELVCPEIRSWDRVYFGFARKWSRVPWVAYEEYVDKTEAKRLFGVELASKIKYTKGEQSQNDNEQGTSHDKDESYTGSRKTALVYQIWDKAGGQKIRYVSPAYKDGFLLVADDELKLTGFFNCPRPVTFIEKTDDMVPTAPYALYEQQAKELNSLTLRITKIVSAIRARGVYDTELGEDVAKIMEGDDNELMPADKSSSLAAEKGFQNAIWFMPLDVLTQTLRELVAARESCKQVIYEITGISDIIRGASKASETLGAQQIKSQWGTLRIKPKQIELQRYACDLLRMTLEIAAQKFSEDTWAKMTGLQYLTTAQIEQGEQMGKAAEQSLQEANHALSILQPPNAQAQADAATAQQTAVTQAHAQTPEQQMAIQANQQKAQQAQETLQQLQQQAQAPKWPEVLASLKDDIQRAYKIDIETNSTIEPEAAEDQKNIADMMAALGQFLQSVGPMVQQGMLPFQVAQSMLLAITRRFRFGDEIEDQIQAMQPPPKQDESKQALEQAQGQIQQLQKQLDQKDMEGQKQELANQQKSTDQQAQLDKATTDTKHLQAQQGLKDEATKLAADKQQLENDRKLFQLEQKHATDKIIANTKVASTELKAKQDTAKASEKNAQDTHKQTSTALKAHDEKLAELVDMIGELETGTASKSKLRSTKLGAQKEITAKVDASVQQAVAAMSSAIKELKDGVQAQISTHVSGLNKTIAATQENVNKQVGHVNSQLEQHRADTAAMVKKLSGPRKKTAKRGPDGRIQAVIDEPVNA